jgi:hypothetical protein
VEHVILEIKAKKKTGNIAKDLELEIEERGGLDFGGHHEKNAVPDVKGSEAIAGTEIMEIGIEIGADKRNGAGNRFVVFGMFTFLWIKGGRTNHTNKRHETGDNRKRVGMIVGGLELSCLIVGSDQETKKIFCFISVNESGSACVQKRKWNQSWVFQENRLGEEKLSERTATRMCENHVGSNSDYG